VSGRRIPASALLASVAVVACFELSGPSSQLSSISPIMLAWPSVVVDDALRDSVGDTAALRVDAFDGDGNPVDDAEIRFILLDTGLTVRSDGVVIGTAVRTTPARVLAHVSRGGEVLQTPEISIHVVPPPDSVAPAQDTTFAPKLIPVTDPDPIPSDSLTVKVLSRVPGGTAVGVRGWIVRYDITDQPASATGERTALFSESGVDSVSVDTTDASGVASRTVVLQRRILARATGRQDVVVQATIRRVGNSGAGTSFKFILPFVGQ
jgi:hypothetical protein